MDNVTTAEGMCHTYNGSPSHCHPTSRTLVHEVLRNGRLCRESALISLMGLTDVTCNCDVNNFSTSGFRNSALALKINGRNRPCRNVKEKVVGVRNLPMCESEVKNMKAPADSRRHAGVALNAARLIILVGKCSNSRRRMHRGTRFVLRLLDGCYGDDKKDCFVCR